MKALYKTYQARKGLLQRTLIATALSILALALSVTSAYGVHAVTVNVPVSQVFTQNIEKDILSYFHYKLTPLKAGNPLPQGGTEHSFVIDGTQVAQIGPFTFHAAGHYAYRLEAVLSDPKAGYTYDEGVFIVNIYVKNANPGLLADIVITNEAGEKIPEVVFVKNYTSKPSDPLIMVDPPVRKTVQGNPSVDGTFTFTLTAADPSQPMPPGSVGGVKHMTIVGAGEEDFGVWAYTKEGVYFYTIAEEVDPSTDYIYDTMIYTITDTVTDINGQLSVSRVVQNGDNRQVTSFDFINTYSPDPIKPKPDPTPTPNPGPGKPGDGPKTGDYNNPLVLIITTALSAAAALLCAVLLIADKMKRDEENENTQQAAPA